MKWRNWLHAALALAFVVCVRCAGGEEMTLPETAETEPVVQAETVAPETMAPEAIAPVTLSASERTPDKTAELRYLSMDGKWDHGPDKDHGHGPDKGRDFRFDGGKGGKK